MRPLAIDCLTQDGRGGDVTSYSLPAKMLLKCRNVVDALCFEARPLYSLQESASIMLPRASIVIPFLFCGSNRADIDVTAHVVPY
jgi:hypothetical protein